MIRTIAMLVFWGLAAPVAALIGFPWTFITGDIRLLYRMFMIGCVEWRTPYRSSRGNRGTRQTRPGAHLYLHVEPCFESGPAQLPPR
jgi:hypothetical protein